MQGLSEAVEVEQRLAGWWQKVHEENKTFPACKEAVGMSLDVYTWLQFLYTPPRIDGIRYEYLLKGDRDNASANQANRRRPGRFVKHNPTSRRPPTSYGHRRPFQTTPSQLVGAVGREPGGARCAAGRLTPR